MPFDKSNVFVWYGQVLVGGLLGLVNTSLITVSITYFMSCSFYIDACCQHFRVVYHQIEEKINSNPGKLYANIPEIKRRLGSAVFLHVKITKLIFNIQFFEKLEF